MAATLTVSIRRPVAIEALLATILDAWRDLLGTDAFITAGSESGATELGGCDDELRLRVNWAELRLTVFGLPDHHCLPEDLAAFWAVVGPAEAEDAASLAATAAVALALAKASSASIVDGAGRWTSVREQEPAAFLEALRVQPPHRGTDGALERFALGLREV